MLFIDGCAGCDQGVVPASEVDIVQSSSISSSSTDCDQLVFITDDTDPSSNVSLCVARWRQSPVYRSRGQQVRVYVTPHRSFLIVYQGRLLITCSVY